MPLRGSALGFSDQSSNLFRAIQIQRLKAFRLSRSDRRQPQKPSKIEGEATLYQSLAHTLPPRIAQIIWEIRFSTGRAKLLRLIAI